MPSYFPRPKSIGGGQFDKSVGGNHVFWDFDGMRHTTTLDELQCYYGWPSHDLVTVYHIEICRRVIRLCDGQDIICEMFVGPIVWFNRPYEYH